jgi:hypothetical protein
MNKFKQKHCTECNTIYQPTGACSKYCVTCKPIFTKLIAKAAVKNWAIKTGYYKGVGSGSKLGPDASNFIHGRSVFRRWAKERKELIGICEQCGKDIKHATHYEWVGHHKDHNSKNNVIENLMLLCKQCHQIEHQCWKAFEGVTTISKESRVDNSPKRTPPL